MSQTVGFENGSHESKKEDGPDLLSSRKTCLIINISILDIIDEF